MSCSELCLPTFNGAVCTCSDGFHLENNTCVKQINYTSHITFCLPETYQCEHTLRCVPNDYLCDGVDNCGDGSDESSEPGGPCEHVSCGENQLKCDKTTCIAKHWVCDGEKDCLDGTDEDPAMCSKLCLATQFKCKKSGRCIPIVWRCDHVTDCGPDDDSDETDCSEFIF